jgi:hypothetical protein
MKKAIFFIVLLFVYAMNSFGGDTGLGTSPFSPTGKLYNTDLNAINDAINDNHDDVTDLEATTVKTDEDSTVANDVATFWGSGEGALRIEHNSAGNYTTLTPYDGGAWDTDNQVVYDADLGYWNFSGEVRESGNTMLTMECISLDDLSDDSSVYTTCVDDFVAGESITVGTGPFPVYMKPDGNGGSTFYGGRIYGANADALETDKDTYPVIGDAITSATSGNAITVDFGRLVKIGRDDGFSFTANDNEGTVGYLSTATDGAVTMTQPTGVGDDITRILIVLRVDDAAGDGPGGADQGDGDIYLRLRQEVSVKVESAE